MKRLMTISAVLLSFSAFAQTDCPNPHDSNDDGAVTISDLLDLQFGFSVRCVRTAQNIEDA